MENDPQISRNLEQYSIPLFLLSLAFFIPYFAIVGVIFSGSIRFVLEFIVSTQTANVLAGVVLLLFPIAIFLLSFYGVFIIRRGMLSESLPLTGAHVLIAVYSMILLSFLVSVVVPVAEVQKYFPLGYFIGIGIFPLGVSYLLNGMRQPGSGTVPTRWTPAISALVGMFGLFIAVLVVYSAITYVPDPPGTPHDIFDFDLLGLLELLLGAIYLLILMPIIGFLLIRLGFRFRKYRPVICNEIKVETKSAAPHAESVQEAPAATRKCLLTPDRQRMVAIVAAILLLFAGIWFVWNLLDTTPGKTWVQTTPSAPFGSKGGYAAAEYNGELWLIGGTGKSGLYGEAWHTSDGVVWARESSERMVPQRMGASSAVFRDALWIIGGTTERGYTLNNDVWFSGDGLTWSQAQPSAGFSPRTGHSSVVFDDRIWVIGGNRGNKTDDLVNDVWYSTDGISWECATPAAEFSPRVTHSSFVFDNKMWFVGGRDSSGYLSDVWNSEDGIHWTQVTTAAPFEKDTPYNVVLFDGRMWVIQNFYVDYKDQPWLIERTQGIWYSYDGSAWSKLMSSPQFFSKEYEGGPPRTMVFDNRLWVIQWYNSQSGVWYTTTGSKSACRPTAQFNANTVNGPAPLTVKFGDESICSPDTWQWDFGDGTQSSSQNPEHTFSAPGNYTVNMTVRNSAGESSRAIDITVFRKLSMPRSDAGKNWKRATDNVPFGKRERYSISVWNNSVWVVAGSSWGAATVYNDTWYSTDGIHWTEAVKNAEFEARSEHSSVAFNDKLWIIGGVTDWVNHNTGMHNPTVKTDAWYSTDGSIWTQAESDATFTPLRYTTSVIFNDCIWLFGEDSDIVGSSSKYNLELWSSCDGVTWNKSALPQTNYYNKMVPVVKDNRVWVLQYEENGGFWSTNDGINRITAATPPYSNDIYSIYTDSLAVYDNKFWLFRALEKRDGRDSLRGELWSSEDGNNWVLITDAVPFADGARALNNFYLLVYDDKLWVYMVRGTSKPFSDSWEWNAEIWYSEMK